MNKWSVALVLDGEGSVLAVVSLRNYKLYEVEEAAAQFDCSCIEMECTPLESLDVLLIDAENDKD